MAAAGVGQERGRAQESGISSWNCLLVVCAVSSGVELNCVLVLADADWRVQVRRILDGQAEVPMGQEESQGFEQQVGHKIAWEAAGWKVGKAGQVVLG
jgi:hypothetical protein